MRAFSRNDDIQELFTRYLTKQSSGFAVNPSDDRLYFLRVGEIRVLNQDEGIVPYSCLMGLS